METESAVSENVESPEVQESAPATEGTVEAPAEHTPDWNRLVDDVEANWDKIPDDMKQKLNKHFQPAFNRRVNLLNDAIDASVRSAIGDVPLPEGKTPLDLLTENDGRGFADFLRGVVAKEFEPVKAKISQAEQQQNLQASIQRAVKDTPHIQPFVEEAVRIIDSDPDLTKIAMLGNGGGLYYALRGVGADLALQQKDRTIRELNGLLEKNKIAVKTSGGTTRVGSGAPKSPAPQKAKTLLDAAKMAMEKVRAEEA
jgi:hypothetical protein